jgi:uncharacterized membrane protein (Fun14 family)
LSLEQVALQIGGGTLIGFVTGWGLKKLLRLIIKIVAVVLAAFFAALLWLELQKIVTVNWKELENQTANSLGSIANATITNGSGNFTVNQVIDTLGIPFAAPMGLAFVAGFMKG